MLLFLSACEPIRQGKHLQQRNLIPQSIDVISKGIDDFLPDPPLVKDEEDDLDIVIDEKFYNKVSISATKDMRLIDALSQLAELAGVNIIIAPDIEGNLACSVKNRRFVDVLGDICASSGLKYTIDHDSVRIEYDSPVLKTYNLQFLNIQRETQSSVSTSTDIFTDKISFNGEGSSSTGGDKNNGSSSLVSGTLKNDFWHEVEENLNQIVGDDGHITVHKQGGLISVYATQGKQQVIRKYLKLLKQSVESQVLIEAKILEVTLDDEFKSGINWNILRNGGAIVQNSSDTNGLFSFGVDRINLNVVAGILEKFGAVKTLSNPRITVLNNQSAVLKVAENEVIYIYHLCRSNMRIIRMLVISILYRRHYILFRLV